MNPFSNGKLIGAIDPREYRKPNASRGDKALVMSRGELFTFAKNPLKWKLGADDDSTKSTEWGSLMDCLITGEDSFNSFFAVHPDTYMAMPKRKGEQPEEKPWTRKSTSCQEWATQRESEGKAVISSELEDSASLALGIVRSDDEIRAMLRESKFQQMATAEYHDKATGLIIPFKILPDIVPPVTPNRKALVDLKCFRSADPNKWPDECWRYGLHWQAAIYLDVWQSATGDDRLEFLHTVQENEPPYVVEKIAMSQEFLEIGRSAYRAALAKYCRCLAANEWPGYPISPEHKKIDGWTYVSPKPWMTLASPERFEQTPTNPPLEMADDLIP